MSYLAGACTADLTVRGMARDEVGVVQGQRPSSRNPVPSPTLLSLVCASDPTPSHRLAMSQGVIYQVGIPGRNKQTKRRRWWWW